MTMRKIIFGACLIVLVAGNLWSRGIEAPSTLVVLPARQRVIEFGFDLIYQQSVTLIAYQQVGPDLLVHLWNGREWVPMTPAAYFAGTFLLGAPEQIILVGDDKLLPSMFQTVPDWCRKTGRVQTLNIASLVNQCGYLLKFDDQQWKWFAGKYGLSLTDSNASRRRWGKYGPPGQEWYRQNPPVKGEPCPPAISPMTPVEPAQPTISPVGVIPDNAPVLVPVTPIETVPAVISAAPGKAVFTPETEDVVPTVLTSTPPAVVVAPAVPEAALAPVVPVEPVAAPVAPAMDVLPPGTTTEVSGK
jgi:hypothetical protein